MFLTHFIHVLYIIERGSVFVVSGHVFGFTSMVTFDTDGRLSICSCHFYFNRFIVIYYVLLNRNCCICDHTMFIPNISLLFDGL